MFEEYLQGSACFYDKARQCKENKAESKMYYRASVFFAASAIEAFINYVANSFEQAKNLAKEEELFLSDKTMDLDTNKWIFQEKPEYHKLDHKIRFLVKRFNIAFNYNSREWSALMQFKSFRDSLVHPRKSDDDIECAEYEKKAKSGLTSIITVISILSKGIFKKPLRKKLMDLIPS